MMNKAYRHSHLVSAAAPRQDRSNAAILVAQPHSLIIEGRLS